MSVFLKYEYVFRYQARILEETNKEYLERKKKKNRKIHFLVNSVI